MPEGNIIQFTTTQFILLLLTIIGASAGASWKIGKYLSEKEIRRIDSNLAQIDKRIDNTLTQMDKRLDSNLSQINKRIDDNLARIDTTFREIKTELSNLRGDIAGLKGDIKYLQGKFDMYLTIKTGGENHEPNPRREEKV